MKTYLKDGYEQYREKVIPTNAGPVQIEECERVWFAACHHVLQLQLNYNDISDLSEQAVKNGVQLLKDLTKEIQDYLDRFKLMHSDDESPIDDPTAPVDNREVIHKIPPGEYKVYWFDLMADPSTQHVAPIPPYILGCWMQHDVETGSYTIHVLLPEKTIDDAKNVILNHFFRDSSCVTVINAKQLDEINISNQYPMNKAIKKRIESFIQRSRQYN